MMSPKGTALPIASWGLSTQLKFYDASFLITQPPTSSTPQWAYKNHKVSPEIYFLSQNFPSKSLNAVFNDVELRCNHFLMWLIGEFQENKI